MISQTSFHSISDIEVLEAADKAEEDVLKMVEQSNYNDEGSLIETAVSEGDEHISENKSVKSDN